MRDDPNLDSGKIAATLGAEYGLHVVAVRFLPIGYDLNAFVYEITVADGTRFFLKIRTGPVHEPGLLVPRALIEFGIEHVLAPLRTRSGLLWRQLSGYPGFTMVLYPFIAGDNAMIVGMSEVQWRAFGSTLRAVHDSGVSEQFRAQLPVEDFALPSAALVRQIQAQLIGVSSFEGDAASFANFWREQSTRIEQMLAWAEELGSRLQAREFDLVLCHADIHAANILVGEDDRIHLIDWDDPKIAPRERDLLFVVGSRIARTVEPSEEAWFFEGYGPSQIDPTALSYYRYERIIEDLGEFGQSVFNDPNLSEEARSEAAALAVSFFAPDGDISRAETLPGARPTGV